MSKDAGLKGKAKASPTTNRGLDEPTLRMFDSRTTYNAPSFWKRCA